MSKRGSAEMRSQKDQLSELPQHILHKILSLLPPEEVMATTVLSSSWRDICMNLPCLNLGKELFEKQLIKKFTAILADTNRPCIGDQLKKQFLDFVDQTLMARSKLRHHNPNGNSSTVPVTSVVQRLYLYMPNCLMTPETTARLDQWINHAINDLQVEELNLYNDFARYAMYKLPCYVFGGSQSLLKRLSLRKVELSQVMVECLASSCPLIERLCLYQCALLHVFKISGFSKLDELVVHNNIWLANLVIDVPSLGSLDYQRGTLYYQRGILYYQQTDTIDCGIQIEMTGRISLRHLRLECDTYPWSPQLVALLSNVEHLVLTYVKLSGDFFISSNCLKSCVLQFCSLFNIKIDAPNLKYVTVSGFEASSFGINYSAIEKGSFSLHLVQTADDIVALLTMLKLNPCENLELDFCALSKDLIISAHLREVSNSLLYHVKHLMLKTDRQLCGQECEILDSLLWLCPNPQTISISIGIPYSKVDKRKVFKFKYFKQGEKGANKCSRCRSLPGLCWQHYLQEASIEGHRKEDATVKNHQRRSKARAKGYDSVKAFFDNARKGDEKIVVNIIS